MRKTDGNGTKPAIQQDNGYLGNRCFVSVPEATACRTEDHHISSRKIYLNWTGKIVFWIGLIRMSKETLQLSEYRFHTFQKDHTSLSAAVFMLKSRLLSTYFANSFFSVKTFLQDSNQSKTVFRLASGSLWIAFFSQTTFSFQVIMVLLTVLSFYR